MQGGNASEGTFKCTPRIATLRNIYTPAQETHIDKAITIYFQAPNSFTGLLHRRERTNHMNRRGCCRDPHARQQGHNLATIRNTQTDSKSKGHIVSIKHRVTTFRARLRQAERGEFTRRAFYNGKLDLTQVKSNDTCIYHITGGSSERCNRSRNQTLHAKCTT